MEKNDGRKVAGYLPELIFKGAQNPVVQIISESSGEILYTVRAKEGKFQPKVYTAGKYTIKVGSDKPDGQTIEGIVASPDISETKLKIKI